MNLFEQDFAHFGYPHTLVTDNAHTFMSDELTQRLLSSKRYSSSDRCPVSSRYKRSRGEVGPNLQAESLSQTKHQEMRLASS